METEMISLEVNGVVVFDLLRPANGRGFHCVELPVRKGKNLLAVRLRSGSSAWGWHCRAATGEGRRRASSPQECPSQGCRRGPFP